MSVLERPVSASRFLVEREPLGSDCKVAVGVRDRFLLETCPEIRFAFSLDELPYGTVNKPAPLPLRRYPIEDLAHSVISAQQPKRIGVWCSPCGLGLKKLRGKEIVRRIGQTRRYESIPKGLKAMVALVVLRNKAIKHLLAATQELRPSRGAPNPRALDTHYDTIRMAMRGIFQELGLAA